MTGVFRQPQRLDRVSLLWVAGLAVAGLLIVGLTLSADFDRAPHQAQAVDTIVKLLGEPSTTGSGSNSP